MRILSFDLSAFVAIGHYLMVLVVFCEGSYVFYHLRIMHYIVHVWCDGADDDADDDDEYYKVLYVVCLFVCLLVCFYVRHKILWPS